MAMTPEQIFQAKRLCYTWRDCFATSIKEIKATDLIEHSIDLESDAKPVRGTLPKYTPQEREFANKIRRIGQISSTKTYRSWNTYFNRVPSRLKFIR